MTHFFLSAIANINLDYCTAGPILSPSASPSLKTVFVEAIRVRNKDKRHGDNIIYKKNVCFFITAGQQNRATNVTIDLFFCRSGAEGLNSIYEFPFCVEG